MTPSVPTAAGEAHGVRLVVPADLEARAGALVGVPYRPKGADPAGWDCMGLLRWCLDRFCGVAVADYAHLYRAEILTGVAGRAERARLIAEGLAAWRPVEPQAGVAAWLDGLGGPGHVGFMVGPRRLLHADHRCGTVMLDLDDPAAGWRLKGAFVPAAVNAIVGPR